MSFEHATPGPLHEYSPTQSSNYTITEMDDLHWHMPATFSTRISRAANMNESVKQTYVVGKLF